MTAQSRHRTPNPHLGAYYGIVASAFASLVVLLAMAEQLGWSDGAVARLMILLPLLLYLAHGGIRQTIISRICSKIQRTLKIKSKIIFVDI